jgi:hypothetical protein
MPTIRSRDSIAAGGQNMNVIQGNQFEFLQHPSNVKVYARQSNAGTPGVGEIEVFLSQTVELPQSPITIAEPGIRQNEDLLVDTFGDRGDRIVVREIETGGAQLALIDVMVVITPVAP